MLLLFRSLLEATAPVVVDAGQGGAPRRSPRNESGWVSPPANPVPRRNRLAAMLTVLPVLRR